MKHVDPFFGIDIRDPEHKKMRELIEHFSTPPMVLSRVLQLINDPKKGCDAVADVIMTDPTITARILHLSNSAYYGLSRSVSDVHQAVVLLGLQTVRTLVVTTSTLSLYYQPGIPGQLCDQMWKHSLATAIFSRFLAARHQPAQNPEDAYIAGLLHDLGKLILLERFPRQYAGILQEKPNEAQQLLRREADAFGFSHPLIGALLAEKWHFPAIIVSTIASHHEAASSDSLPGLVGLANAFVTTQGYNIHDPDDDETAVIEKMGWEKESAQLETMLQEQLSLFKA